MVSYDRCIIEDNLLTGSYDPSKYFGPYRVLPVLLLAFGLGPIIVCLDGGLWLTLAYFWYDYISKFVCLIIFDNISFLVASHILNIHVFEVWF